jgi:hypothetical protein
VCCCLDLQASKAFGRSSAAFETLLGDGQPHKPNCTNRPSITSLHLISVSIYIFETSASLGHLSESIRARDVNVPSCRRLGTTSFDSRSDQKPIIRTLRTRQCSLLPPPLSNLRQKLRARAISWSYADQRDRQSLRTGHDTIPQASVGSPIRGKLMDFS